MRFEDESHGSFSSDKSFSSEEDDTSSNQITTRRSTEQTNYDNVNPANLKFTLLFNMNFSICPEKLPHPSYKEDILYKNEKDSNDYYAKVNNFYFLPYANSLYNSFDGDNSSIRLIRPSLHALPNDKNFYSKTKIKLGFNIEPFANIGHDTESITTVKEKKNIVQCSYCKAFYSENFKINIEEDNYVIYKNAYQCGICGNKGTFYSQGNNEQLSNEIPNNIKKEDIKSIPKQTGKTIDYVFDEEIKIEDNLLFMIDVSKEAIYNSFSQYIIDSLRQICLIIGDKESNTKYAIALYDNTKISFYIKNKNNISIYYMTDMNNPFNPIKAENLFVTADNLLLIIEKILSMELFTVDNYNRNMNSGSGINSCIYSAFALASSSMSKEKYFNVMILTCNHTMNGIMHFDEINFSIIEDIIEKENYKLYTPQHNFITNLNNSFTSKHLSISFYVTGNGKNQIHLANYYGYDLHYYNINYKDERDIKQKYEKIYYDMLSYIFTDNNAIYDISYKLYFNPYKFDAHCVMFNKSNSNSKITSLRNPKDFSLLYEVKQYKACALDERANFQFAISFISAKDNKRHLRLLNISLPTSKEYNTVYNSIDVDCLTKLILCTEILATKCNHLILAKENLTKIIIEILFVYKNEIYAGNPMDELVYPFSLKYFVLYVFSFFNNFYIQSLRQFNITESNHFNNISYLLYHLFNRPLDKVIRMIYPMMINLANDKKYEQLGLSIFYLKLNMIVLINNSEYTYLYVFKQTNESFIMKYCNGDSFDELIVKPYNDIQLSFDDDSFVQQITVGNPVKIILAENDKFKEIVELKRFLVEDSYYYVNNPQKGKKYCDYIKEINDGVIYKVIENM